VPPLARDHVKLYFEHVILCPGKSSPIGETGFWPDALAPLTDPFGMAAPFREAVRNRGIWIDVITPPDLPAGDYAGTIRITQNGQEIDKLNLRLKVYNFALPAETHLITYMGVSGAGLAAAITSPLAHPKLSVAAKLPCLPLCQPHGAVVQ